MKLSSNVASRKLKCVTVTHCYAIRPKTEPPNPRYRGGLGIEQWNSNDYCWRALGSIFDDSCTLLDGARQLNGSYKLRAIKSVKLSSNVASRRLKCVTVIHFYTIDQKRSRQIPDTEAGWYRNSEIPTTTAGGLWGAYLMTVVHF